MASAVLDRRLNAFFDEEEEIVKQLTAEKDRLSGLSVRERLAQQGKYNELLGKYNEIIVKIKEYRGKQHSVKADEPPMGSIIIGEEVPAEGMKVAEIQLNLLREAANKLISAITKTEAMAIDECGKELIAEARLHLEGNGKIQGKSKELADIMSKTKSLTAQATTKMNECITFILQGISSHTADTSFACVEETIRFIDETIKSETERRAQMQGVCQRKEAPKEEEKKTSVNTDAMPLKIRAFLSGAFPYDNYRQRHVYYKPENQDYDDDIELDVIERNVKFTAAPFNEGTELDDGFVVVVIVGRYMGVGIRESKDRRKREELLQFSIQSLTAASAEALKSAAALLQTLYNGVITATSLGISVGNWIAETTQLVTEWSIYLVRKLLDVMTPLNLVQTFAWLASSYVAYQGYKNANIKNLLPPSAIVAIGIASTLLSWRKFREMSSTPKEDAETYLNTLLYAVAPLIAAKTIYDAAGLAAPTTEDALMITDGSDAYLKDVFPVVPWGIPNFENSPNAALQVMDSAIANVQIMQLTDGFVEASSLWSLFNTGGSIAATIMLNSVIPGLGTVGVPVTRFIYTTMQNGGINIEASEVASLLLSVAGVAGNILPAPVQRAIAAGAGRIRYPVGAREMAGIRVENILPTILRVRNRLGIAP